MTPDAYSEPGYLLDYPAEGTLYVSPYRASGSYVLRYYKIYIDIVLTTDTMPFTDGAGWAKRWPTTSATVPISARVWAEPPWNSGRSGLICWSRTRSMPKPPSSVEAYRQIVADQKERD